MSSIEEDLKRVPDKTLWAFRNEGCRRLIRYARERITRQLEAAGASRQDIMEAGKFLDPDALTMGFARRFAPYKRPTLLLHDPDRLARLLQNVDRPVQLIIAGKAHPKDEAGKFLVKAWTDFIRRPDVRPRAIFIADYDMSLAEQLVQGVDLWINTPRRPWEASGTSGMKVLVNGGLNLSELDGWWAEAYRPEVGWALGDGREHNVDPTWDAREAEQLYRLLEEEVIPPFYDRDSEGIPKAWTARMRLSMAELTPRFSTNRMVREYVERIYLPAVKAYRQRVTDNAQKSLLLSRWLRSLEDHWQGLRFEGFEVEEKDGRYRFEVQVHLNGLDPSTVQVQLYADPQSGGEPEIHAMKQGKQMSNPAGGCYYDVRIQAQRPVGDYTPRIVPDFEGALVPLEADRILWYR